VEPDRATHSFFPRLGGVYFADTSGKRIAWSDELSSLCRVGTILNAAVG